MSQVYVESAKFVGGVIKEIRKEKGFSVEQLSKKLGYSSSLVTSWERGNILPRHDQILKISAALQVDPERFKVAKVKEKTREAKSRSVIVEHHDVASTPVKPPFSTDLKIHRLANKLTLTQLGELVGLTPSTIYKYEKGKSLPSKASLAKLNDIFGYQFDTPTREPNPRYAKKSKKKEDTEMKVPAPVVIERPVQEKKEPDYRPSEFDINFFSNCVEFLKTSQKSEKDICEEAGIVNGYLSRNPESRCTLSLELALKIVNAFGIPLEEFLKDSEQEKIKRQINIYKKKIAELESKLS